MKKRHRLWLDQFLINCIQMNKSEYTIKNYRADLTKFIRWYEANSHTLLNKANGQVVSNYKNFLTLGQRKNFPNRQKTSKLTDLIKSLGRFWKPSSSPPLLEQSPLSVSSRRRHLSSLKNFFEYLKQIHEDKSRLFRNNPVKSKIHSIKLKDMDVRHTSILTKEEWKSLNEHIHRTRDRLIVHLLYWAGLRLSELAQLKVEDFDLNSKTLRFKRKGGDIHTFRPQRSVLIFALFEKYLSWRASDARFLFINKKGHPLTPKSIYNILIRLFKQSGCSLNLTPHSFRKACATNLYIRKKDLLFVRDYLNHKDAKVTQTYIDKKTLYAQSTNVFP